MQCLDRAGHCFSGELEGSLGLVVLMVNTDGRFSTVTMFSSIALFTLALHVSGSNLRCNAISNRRRQRTLPQAILALHSCINPLLWLLMQQVVFHQRLLTSTCGL